MVLVVVVVVQVVVPQQTLELSLQAPGRPLAETPPASIPWTGVRHRHVRAGMRGGAFLALGAVTH